MLRIWLSQYLTSQSHFSAGEVIRGVVCDGAPLDPSRALESSDAVELVQAVRGFTGGGGEVAIPPLLTHG